MIAEKNNVEFKMCKLHVWSSCRNWKTRYWNWVQRSLVNTSNNWL